MIIFLLYFFSDHVAFNYYFELNMCFVAWPTYSNICTIYSIQKKICLKRVDSH